MPITAQLENIKKDESLKEYLGNEFKSLKSEIEFSEQRLKTELAKGNLDMMIKILGIVVGTVSIAVAVIKLFP